MTKFTFLCTVALLFATTTFGQDQHLLGQFDRQALFQEPFSTWYRQGYEQYQVRKSYFKNLQTPLKDITVKVFLGTWCGDSKREVPQFLKILDSQNVKPSQIELIGTGESNGELYKQSPQHQEQGLGIFRVPTFVFFKDGKEIARIIESPVVSLESDINHILNHEKYKPNYTFGNAVFQGIETKQIVPSSVNMAEWADEYKNRSTGSSELNALGYVLLKQNRTDDALFVFNLNALLYPNVGNVHDSLGEAHLKAGNKTLAIACYQKVLLLDPKNQNALRILKTLGQ